MRFFLLIIFLTFSFALPGQQENRTRTRPVDYAEYDRLISNFSYATDKVNASNQLLAFVGKNFTPEDEEYFFARYLVAIQLTDNLKRTELLQQAIEAYDKHYPFYNRGFATVNSTYIGQVYLLVSQFYQEQHLYYKNIRFLEANRNLLESSDDPYIRRTFHLRLGESLFQTEQYEESIKVLMKLKELTDSGAFAYKYASSDEVYKIDPSWPEETKQQMLKSKAAYEVSMKNLNESQVIYQRLDYSNYLARAYFSQYQFKASVPFAKQVADDMSWINNNSKQLMAQSSQLLNDPSMADSTKDLISQSIAVQEIFRHVMGSSLLCVIGSMKSDQKVLAKQYATDLISQGVYYQLLGDYKSSEESFTKLYQAIGKLKLYNQYKPAAENLERVWNPYYLNLKVKSNHTDQALKIAQDIISKQEQELIKNFQYFTENEKKEFFKNYTKELERYYSLLLLLYEKGDGHTDEMLNKILQTKGLILDATREQEKQLRKIKDKVTLTQIAEIKRLRDKLAAFSQQPGSNPAIADSINRISVRIGDLERAVNLKLVAVNLLKPIRWQDVQGRLKRGEVYFEIIRLQRDTFEYDKPNVQYWAFVIKPDESKPTLFKISEGEAFEGRSLRNYQNLVRAQLEDTESYTRYWKKISEHAQDATTIVVSSDGVYHIINPVALKNPDTKKFVLDEIEVRRVSTGRDLLVSARADVPNKIIVLVGNPRFDMSRKQGGNIYRSNEMVPVDANETMRSGIADLPGTKKEIELIGSKAGEGGFKIQTLTGSEANESNVKQLNSPAILHLATHGQFDALSKVDTYLKSKLILAGAADNEPLLVSDYTLYEDGFLTAYEVTQLELPGTQLVVLSACETGLGEIQSGEGVWGLQRAFQLAGSRAVMGSLWKISDEATVVFMDAFYDWYLKTDNISQAYNHAMQTTRQEYPQPYYWGAFTLIGAN